MNSYEGLVALMIPVVSVISVFTFLYFQRRFLHIERLSMLEKGYDKDLFNAFGSGFSKNKFTPMRYGLLLMGLGVGLLVASVLERAGLAGDPIYPGCLMLFGGVGLVLAYIIQSKKEKEEMVG